MPASHAEVVLAYRHLSKTLLRATQYSKPARFVTRDHLRSAFRSSPLSAFDAQRISRTIEFAQGAIESTGLEHKIIKNLVHVWWMRQRLHSQRPMYVAFLHGKGAQDRVLMPSVEKPRMRRFEKWLMTISMRRLRG